ncbi:MAG: hypothetical protein CL955_06890 [Erythrobacteraceae bacterium]|nr:hypothetical protein [Erythrobacteraceae bacterium]|tara:strand:+ start:1025 stop:1369 length:345 start_codon:yes stop_codon:yes gene_type:complete
MLEKLRDYIRPLTVAALVAVLLIGAVASGVLEAVVPGLGVRFTEGVAGWFKAIPQPFYNLATVFGLGYVGARTLEKAVATHSTAKYNPPARSDVDGDARPMPEPEFGFDQEKKP